MDNGHPSWVLTPGLRLRLHIDGQVNDDGRHGPFRGRSKPSHDAAFDAGLEVTALHNHFFFDQPKVYFMHVGGHGRRRGNSPPG